MSPRTDTKVQVNVRVRQGIADQLRAVAEVDGVNPSELAEEAFADLIDKRKTDETWQEKHKQWADRQRALLKSMRV